MWILLLCMSAVQAAEPEHLKPGGLVGHLGQIALVEDLIFVRYPYATLRVVPRRLKETLKEINSLFKQMNDEANKHINTKADDPSYLLKLFASRLSYVNDSLTIALESYVGLDGPARSKRGLMNGLGELSRDLFGTAMEKDVVELRDRYNQLTTIANANNRAIRINCVRLAKLGQHVDELGTYANRLKLALDKILSSVDSVYEFMVIHQALPALENSVNTIMHANQQIISNVVDAVHGRVTPTLFPAYDFQHVLELGKKEYGLTPLFDIRGIHHYYPLLTSFITRNDIVIHVPFQSKDLFNVYSIFPFPFSANNTLLTLDLQPSIALISLDYKLYATGSHTDLQQCRTEFLNHYHCPASLFAFLPLTEGVCEVVLIQNATEKALSLCPYITLAPRPIFHETFFNHHYFFFTQPYYIYIICPDGTVYKEVSGHLAVYFACYIHSASLSTFPSKLHQGFVGNISYRVYTLTSLSNIHISSINTINDRVAEFKFSNVSHFESVVQDVLPSYLHPSIHYPSIIAPIIIIVVIAIPLCCYVRKALTLYNFLRAERRTAVRERDTNV